MNRTPWHLPFAMVISAFALAAPALAAQPDWPPSVDALAIAARKALPTVGMKEYRRVVDEPKDALLLDVREPDEFAAGHVPGAINIPRGVLEFRIWKVMGYPGKVNLDRTIYVQCLTGGRASLAARTLETLGFHHPVVVLMDFREWEKASNPVVK